MLNTFIKELKELTADKKIWIGILTVLIIIIISTSYNKKNPEIDAVKPLMLGVINKDNSSYSNLLLDYFHGSNTFSSLIQVTTGDDKVIRDAFKNGELDIYLEIPEDFAMNMIKLEHSPVKVYYQMDDTTKALLFQNVLKSYEKYISAVEVNAVGLYEIMEADGMGKELIEDANVTISMDMIFTALGKESFFRFKPVAKFPTTTVAEYYIISIIVMTLMYAGIYAGFRILREMKQGTFARLKTTKLPLFQFLTAKLLLMIMVYTIAIAVSIHILGKNIDTGLNLLYSFTLSCFSAVMATFLCALLQSTLRYSLAANLFVFYCIVMGGGIIPIQFLPEDIIRLSKITPIYYMIKGIILLKQGQTTPVYSIVAGLLITSVILFVVAAACFYRRSVVNEEA
ncbi:MAG: hypothetical protein K0S76_1233 [Herbinix sp.]|jgi:ABC-2 type transport system permease protein|nr:hypothetical protein [Herbinix sp.]